MTNKSVLSLLLLALLAGCSTTMTPNGGYQNDILTFRGQKWIRYQDPTLAVNPGAVANNGINGPSGPYAAALGVGNIQDPAARKDAAETMKVVAENESYWGGGRALTGRHTVGAFGVRTGYLINNEKNTQFAAIDDGRPQPIPPGQKGFFTLTPGKHLVKVYDRDGNFVKDKTLSINESGDDPTGKWDWYDNI